MRDLPVLGEDCHRLLADFARTPDLGRRHPRPRPVRRRLGRRAGAAHRGDQRPPHRRAHLEGLSDSDSDFLLDHAHSVQAKIEDQALRNLHVMVE